MKVYVVVEEDRGCGAMVVGVYQSYERAMKVAHESSRYYIDEAELELETEDA